MLLRLGRRLGRGGSCPLPGLWRLQKALEAVGKAAELLREGGATRAAIGRTLRLRLLRLPAQELGGRRRRLAGAPGVLRGPRLQQQRDAVVDGGRWERCRDGQAPTAHLGPAAPFGLRLRGRDCEG